MALKVNCSKQLFRWNQFDISYNFMQVSYILSQNWKYLLQIPCNPNLTKVEQQGLYLPSILPLNLEQTKLRNSNTKDTKINLDFPKTQTKSKQTRWIKIGMTSSYGPKKNGCHIFITNPNTGIYILFHISIKI